MHPTLTIASRAAKKAGDFIARAFERVDQLDIQQKAPLDYVTEIDKGAEQIILKVLKEKYPDHSYLCEESGQHYNAESEYEWIIDPLDGTTNFIHGIPHFAVSIALKKNNIIEQAIVYDPIRQEEFVASRGRGAQLNGRRIRVSSQNKIAGSVIASCAPSRAHLEHLQSGYWQVVQEIAPITAGMRQQGSAALDLAYVAAGRQDAYFEFGLQAWDIAGGSLLVKESGGMIVDPWGGESYLQSGHVLSANPGLLKQLLKTIMPQLPSK